MKNSAKKSAKHIMLIITTLAAVQKSGQAMQMVNPNGNPVQVQNQNDPIVQMQGELNMMPSVPAMTQTIASATGGGAKAVTAFFMNEDSYQITPTNNGSNAGSVTNAYGDGWSGKGYNNLAKGLSPSNGIKCYGFTLIFTNTGTGAQDAAGINSANPTWLMANLVGAYQIPKGFVLSAGARNTQYLAGTMTVRGVFYINPLIQIGYNVPVGDTAQLTVMCEPF